MNSILEKTTFIVKTFMRPKCLNRLIKSIHGLYPGARILVADDSKQPVQRTDAHVHALPYDYGLSYGRNYLVDQVNTDFVVLMDDDHVFTQDTRIERLVQPLEDGTFDLVGAFVHESQGHFPWEGIFQRDGEVLTISAGHRGEVDGVFRVDMCHNFFAARTEAVRSVRWDENFKLGEHLDFFLRAHSKIRIGVCPAVSVFHAPESPDGYSE